MFVVKENLADWYLCLKNSSGNFPEEIIIKIVSASQEKIVFLKNGVWCWESREGKKNQQGKSEAIQAIQQEFHENVFQIVCLTKNVEVICHQESKGPFKSFREVEMFTLLVRNQARTEIKKFLERINDFQKFSRLFRKIYGGKTPEIVAKESGLQLEELIPAVPAVLVPSQEMETPAHSRKRKETPESAGKARKVLKDEAPSPLEQVSSRPRP